MGREHGPLVYTAQRFGEGAASLSKRKKKTGDKKRRSGKVIKLPVRQTSSSEKTADRKGLPDIPESRPHSSVNR